jgi:hypothetical protein
VPLAPTAHPAVRRAAAHLDTLLDPLPDDGRTFACYALPPLSRIACELMQARLRKQAAVFGLDDELVTANVERAGRVARIDAGRMTSLNDALAAALVGDATYRLGVLRTFVRARRRLVRVRRGVEAVLALGEPPTALAMRAFFDAVTTFHELGALKFGFPHEPVRARFVALLGGIAPVDPADARRARSGSAAGTPADVRPGTLDGAAYDALLSPPGASLFARLADARIRLAHTRASGRHDRYRDLIARWAPRFEILHDDDVQPAGARAGGDAVDALDAEVAAVVAAFGSAEALRAELDRRRVRRQAREREHNDAVARFRAAIAARREERLWAIGMLQLLHAMALHEDRNRVEKMRFLRAYERTCVTVGLAASEVGIRDVLEALCRPPHTSATAPAGAPAATGLPSARAKTSQPGARVALPRLFTRVEESAGSALLAGERARLATAAALEARFRERPDLLPVHLASAHIERVDELTGNLCDLIVRCTFDTGDTIVGKGFLPVVKERPTLAFHPSLARRGHGIDRRMNLFAERLAAAELDPCKARIASAAPQQASERATSGASGRLFGATRADPDPPTVRVRVPRAYGYDAAWRVVWMQDVAKPAAGGASAAPLSGSALRPLARADWTAALPALARALAAVHAPGVDSEDVRSLRAPLRAAYLTAHPARFLAPYLDSPRRARRWRRFIALDAAARRALIHGDLCPKNIVRDGDGTLWLLDFDRANVASPAYDVGVFAAHLLIDGWLGRTDPAADADAPARFVAAYMEAAGAAEPFAFRVAMHAALALAYRAGTPDFIGIDGSDLQHGITKQIAALLDRREPWRALAHTF